MINKHKSNKIKENSNTVRHLNNGTDHRHSKSCCDQSSPARRTIIQYGYNINRLSAETVYNHIRIYICVYVGSALYDHWTISLVPACRCQIIPLRRRHNGRDGVSNHQPHDCLLNRLFRRRSKKISKHRVTGFCEGNSPGPVNSPHKWPVTW